MADDLAKTTAVESRVRTLEAELQKATERSRLAKIAVKDAKALAKAARKDKRIARRALIAAQEEHAAALQEADKEVKDKPRVAKTAKTKTAKAPVVTTKPAAFKISVADSPEKNPPLRVRKKKAKQIVPPSTDDATLPSAPTGEDSDTPLIDP